jgi:methyltransferase (TIGR00027 family)
METGQPSLTALGAARLRAAHQVLDHASILIDPLAVRILGEDISVSLDHARAHAAGPRLRWFIAARSRIAEDALNVAVSAGATQLVVLGAGLDTLACRTPLAGRLRMFEVDHPATQRRKRQMLDDAAIDVPDTLRFVSVDFERETLAGALRSAGFDESQRSFFSWLGVVPYLTEPAIFSTLEFIARLEGGAEVIFDYVNPVDSVAPAARAVHQLLADRVAAVGEPMQSYLDTAPLCDRMRATGFRDVVDIGASEIATRFFPEVERAAPTRGGHVMHASTN